MPYHPTWCDVSALLTYGSYVEVDADSDHAVLVGVDASGAEDAGADRYVFGEAGADVVGVGVRDPDIGEVGDGEADEDRGTRGCGRRRNLCADADALADCDVPWDDDDDAPAEEDALQEADGAEAEPDTPVPHVRPPWIPALMTELSTPVCSRAIAAECLSQVRGPEVHLRAVLRLACRHS